MKIAVCVKQVIDTCIPLEADLASDTLSWSDAPFYMLNPMDGWGIERAAQLKEQQGKGTVIAVSLGPSRVERALRECLSLGADQAIRIDDASFEGQLDTLGTAVVLSRAIASLETDLVLCGAISTDAATGSVGPALAELLGLPHVSWVTDFELREDGRSLVAHRQMGKGDRELVGCPFPSVLTLSAPRGPGGYSSLPMVMRARKSSVHTLRADDLGLANWQDLEGLRGTHLVKVSSPRPRPKKTFLPDSSLSPTERLNQLLAGGSSKRKGDLLEGKPEELAANAIEFLRQQALLPS